MFIQIYVVTLETEYFNTICGSTDILLNLKPNIPGGFVCTVKQ